MTIKKWLLKVKTKTYFSSRLEYERRAYLPPY